MIGCTAEAGHFHCMLLIWTEISEPKKERFSFFYFLLSIIIVFIYLLFHFNFFCSRNAQCTTAFNNYANCANGNATMNQCYEIVENQQNVRCIFEDIVTDPIDAFIACQVSWTLIKFVQFYSTERHCAKLNFEFYDKDWKEILALFGILPPPTLDFTTMLATKGVRVWVSFNPT